MGPHRERYREASVDWLPRKADLVVRVSHPRFVVGGRTETAVNNWAHLNIEMRPARLIAEWALFTEYLESFAERSIPLEQAACEIAEHIKETIRPASVTVALSTVGDGGFLYEVTAV